MLLLCHRALRVTFSCSSLACQSCCIRIVSALPILRKFNEAFAFFSAGCAAFPELLPCKTRFRGERRVMILFLLIGLCVCAARDDHRCSVLLASAETAMTYALIP